MALRVRSGSAGERTHHLDDTVHPTLVDGEALDILGEGVVHGCGGEVTIELGDEEEVETPTPLRLPDAVVLT